MASSGAPRKRDMFFSGMNSMMSGFNSSGTTDKPANPTSSSAAAAAPPPPPPRDEPVIQLQVHRALHTEPFARKIGDHC